MEEEDLPGRDLGGAKVKEEEEEEEGAESCAAPEEAGGRGVSGEGAMRKVLLGSLPDPGWERHRRHFQGFCYWEAEGPREVRSRLRDLCHRWLQPEQWSKAQILALVVLEQFLAVLPLEMESWVGGRGPESSAQAAALAEGFLLLSQAGEAKPEEQETELWAEADLRGRKAEASPSDAQRRLTRREVKQEEGDGDATL